MARGPARAVAMMAILVLAWHTVDVRPAGAVADGGGRTTPKGATRAQRYSPPVDAPVADPFRLPLGHYGPGNRGLEYHTAPGTPVRAIGDGRVAFAGSVAGRLVVSIDHPDGLRSSSVGLAVVSVRVGQQVSAGEVVGSAGPTLHLGVRRDGRYLDPATLFARRGPARLVPVGGDVDRTDGSGRTHRFGGHRPAD
ncbi:MAG: murein hydrolase activator EnvC family protein [Microthrixaceae bacterium]